MKKRIFTFLTAMMLAASPAWAAHINIGVDDATDTDWESLVDVELGDKQFSYSSQTGVGDDVRAEFHEVIPNSIYNLSLHELEEGPTGDFELRFSVAILSPFDLILDLVDADLDSTNFLDDTSVIVEIYADSGFTTLLTSLTSINGSSSGPVLYSGGDQIWVRMIGDVSGDGILSDVTLEISQTPEPSSIALAAMGAGGLWWMRRRRLKQKQV